MNWDEPLAFALSLANQVGKQLVARRHQVTAEIKYDGSLVTEADIEADHLIRGALRARFPDHGIVSEELAHDVGDEAFQWVVDPIDGTTNYVGGLPIWGVLLALLHQGRPVLAVEHFPCLEECYYARLGGGAFCNDRPLHTSQSATLHPNQILVACSRSWRHFEVTGIRAKPRVLGAVGYEFALVARGTAMLGLAATPHVWDLAGGWLPVTEAGGAVNVVPDRSGPLQTPFPVQAGINYRDLTFPLLMAANQALFERAAPHVSQR